MTDKNSRSLFGLADSTTVLRAHIVLVLAVTTLVVSTAMGVLFSRPVVYQSTASVLVNPMVLSGAVAQPVDMATEKAVTSSGAVLSIASEDLGIPISDLVDNLSVDVPVDTRILEITASSTTVAEARRLAGAIANAYVSYRANLYKEVASEDGTRPVGPTLPDTGPPSSTAAAEIVSPPSTPTGPARPNPLMVLVASLVAGVGLGVGVALLRDHLDGRVRGALDLATTSGLPVLATVPNLAPRRLARIRPGPVPLASPRNTDAYRLLRARTLSQLGGASAKVLLVTSAAQQGLARTAATNLAIVVAQAKKHVVLLTPSTPSAAPFDGVPDADGFLAAGTVSFDSPEARLVLERLTDLADLVIIAAPPLLTGADTRTLAEHVDSILLVEQQGASTHERVAAGLSMLKDVPGTVIGAVLVEGRKTRVRVDVSDPTPQQAAATVRTERRTAGVITGDPFLP
jgi:capsular polysaccharide biosynthesis protein